MQDNVNLTQLEQNIAEVINSCNQDLDNISLSCVYLLVQILWIYIYDVCLFFALLCLFNKTWLAKYDKCNDDVFERGK